MTPDDMIRVYAERQAATPAPTLSRSNTASPFNAASAAAGSGNNPDDLLRAYAERRTSAGLKRSSSLFTATPATDGISPDDMLRAYAERRSSTQATPGINRSDNSASPFTSAPSNEGTTPDDMLRAYAERRAAARTSGSGPTPTTPKLEKRPSFSGNAFVGGFAMALAGKKGKKSRESRQVTPPSAYVAPTTGPHLRSASSSSSLTGSTGVGNVGLYQLPPVAVSYTVTETQTVDGDPFASSRPTTWVNTRDRTDSVGVGSYGGAKYAIGDALEDEHQVYGEAT